MSHVSMIRDKIRDLKRLRTAGMYVPYMLVAVSIGSIAWRIFGDGIPYGEIPKDVQSQTMSVVAFVAVCVAVATQSVIDGLIALAEIHLDHAEREAEKIAAAERRSRGEYTLAEFGAYQRGEQ